MPPTESNPVDGQQAAAESPVARSVAEELVERQPVDEETRLQPAAIEVEAGAGTAARPPMEWQWVVRWRRTAEPIPFAPGIAVAAFATLLVTVVILTVSLGLAGMPIVAVVANVVIAAGLAPALWFSWRIPVLRWFAWGTAIGLVAGWVGVLAASVPSG